MLRCVLWCVLPKPRMCYGWDWLACLKYGGVAHLSRHIPAGSKSHLLYCKIGQKYLNSVFDRLNARYFSSSLSKIYSYLLTCMYVCTTRMYIESHIEASWMKVVPTHCFTAPSIHPSLHIRPSPHLRVPLLSPTLSPSIYMHLRSADYSTVGVSKS